ncbi:hypothetical protein [uncultured Brachyspira sp.]|uniref:hypothetical protein n=1 Tax=uncultured Brachyspira sp. TaxID=221953 RepID=UPI0025D19630|nr:hypothetical protein [uncultured Brachyspira sp.]
MIKKILIVFILVYISAFAYNKEMNNLYNAYYNSNTYDELKDLIKKVENLDVLSVEKQTYSNLILIIDMYTNPKSKRESYKILNENIKTNTPLKSQSDADYLASVADVMSTAINYSPPLNEIIKLSSKASELYDTALKINPNHFPSLLGKAILTAFTPPFVGGGIDKAMPIFKKSESNAKEKWEKHIVSLWVSQVYLKNNDKANYEKYMNTAKSIFSDGAFLKQILEKNASGKSMFN